MLTREEADEYLDARRSERRLTLRAGFHPEALPELDDAIRWCDKGGQGRGGRFRVVLACLAVLDGLPPARAVYYVRENYHPSAVETPQQATYVARFTVP